MPNRGRCVPQTGAVQPTWSCSCCVQRQEDTAVKQRPQTAPWKIYFICEQQLMRRVTFSWGNKLFSLCWTVYQKHFNVDSVFFFYLFRTSSMGVIRFLSVHYNSRGCVGKTWAGLYKSCKAACQAFLHVGCVLICMAKARGFIWFHTGGHTEVKRLRILVFFVKLSQFKHRRDRQKIR